VAAQVAALTQAGGEVWFGDETTLREYPPLRATWAKRGAPANVVLSGRNARRVIHGALNAATGELLQLVRARSRQDDCLDFVETLGPAAAGGAQAADLGQRPIASSQTGA
jgi:hypothetical protein